MGQSAAPSRLRDAGLSAAFPTGTDISDIEVSSPEPARGSLGGFLNERALLEMVAEVDTRVRSAWRSNRFPLLYGGDCAVLLGAVPALRDHHGAAGLVFIDGHEDATTLEQSTSGEAANMEIALLLGMTGHEAPEPLRSRLPALDPTAIATLGQRDENYRREIGVPSIANRVLLHDSREVRLDPERAATNAAAHVSSLVANWWLHVDLDVLDAEEFHSCGAASDPLMPKGLTWTDLTTITRIVISSSGCRGWSIGVYNPDLDPDGTDARRVASYIVDLIER